MKVHELLEAELRHMKLSTSPGEHIRSVDLELESGRLHVELAAVDKIGCSQRHLAFHTERLVDAGIDRLKEISASLAAQLIYLLEPISPIEIDGQGVAVQLRSNPPHQQNDDRQYFELVVRQGQISLRRYSKSLSQVRQPIPAQLTREVLMRLAGDLVAAVPED